MAARRTAWSHVVIPLDAFANFPDLTSNTYIDFINVVFEHDYQTNSGFAHASTVYIDNLSFGTAQPAAVRIDHFGDNWGSNALGGNNGTMANDGNPGTTVLTYTLSPYHNAAWGMKFDYFAATGNWCGVWMQFGSGSDGITASPHNFSDYTKLRLSIKGDTGSTPPLQIKIELVDSGGIHKAYIPDNSVSLKPISPTDWNDYEIPLSAFTGLDTSSIKQLNIVFEDQKVGTPAGTVYFDDIEFGQ